MSDWLEKVKSGHLWSFPGGVHPPENKEPAASQPLRRLPLPATLVLPLRQHVGQASDLKVAIGERVRKGQALTGCSAATGLPIHAPTSGTVIAIEDRPSAHPSALPETALILAVDGLDEWCPQRQLEGDPLQLPREQLLRAIVRAGIAGLGGAGFPTARKLMAVGQARLMIINGVECEPYISCDDALMRHHAAEIIRGIAILAHIAAPQLVVIAIEDNKPEAIAAMRAAMGQQPFQLRVIPTRYPSGGERQLIQLLTGQEVPSGGHPADIGILMHNVGTAFAIKRALDDGEPLIERVVTVAGNAVTAPGNYWVALGTPVSHLLEQCGWQQHAAAQVVMGGPMMGFTLPHTAIPVVKLSNCILAPQRHELTIDEIEQPCIRCGACAEVCPAQLLPQQLFWHSSTKNHTKAREYNLFDCIECGACAYVCPSAIPLIHYYRQEKAEIRAIDLDTHKAELAKARFEARQQRLEREKLEREQRQQQMREQRPAASDASDDSRSTVQAALERAKARRLAVAESETAPTSAEQANSAAPDNSAIMAERARRRAEREAQRASEAGTPAKTQTPTTSAAEKPSSPPATNAASLSPAQAAVAAAIARAKAKQAASNAVTSSEHAASAAVHNEAAAPNSEADAPAHDADPRKAAVAAAIARAKARQAATQAASNAEANANSDAPAHNSDKLTNNEG